MDISWKVQNRISELNDTLHDLKKKKYHLDRDIKSIKNAAFHYGDQYLNGYPQVNELKICERDIRYIEELIVVNRETLSAIRK